MANHELTVVETEAKPFHFDFGNDASATALTKPQQQELALAVQRRRIDLAEDVAARTVRLQASSVDMDQTIRTAQELSRTRGDYAIRSSHETASGHTEITVRRSVNTFVWVAVIVGMIILAKLFIK